ncbi:PQQ-binding-like beta-propeller repeat protein [Candidatus Bathycorpusculum sp.]|uniref:outer membrane protein assembly factor BamB family protein n=1 Tax=Candidatus Bathycorpusculum sp. TaxID=2994959 RepID=UPI00281C45E8|nr:PQQ-binding-like beta-propeller repeat protein [Candidatus Termitimicrobium sp.]MCL2432836.1 PQQ-binding-like beta-propeller repeat protein [Candidatus Termitimicrobium sp.]
MQTNNKLFASLIILILAISSITTLVSLIPVTSGFDAATDQAIREGMTWTGQTENATQTRLTMWERYKDRVPTYTYAMITPNPVGIGQRTTIVMFMPMVPMAATDANKIAWEYKVVITDPDGISVTLPTDGGTFTSDSTGSTFTDYTPTKLGNYSYTIIFEELFYKWDSTAAMRNWYGIRLLSSNRTYTVTVQEEPVYPIAVTRYPLPEEYWSRPIEGQNDSWGAISSNWLNNAKDRDFGSSQNRFQTEGIAPNTGHILWTKVTEDGGVVGGDQYFSQPGEVFNAGHQYQTRFQTQIIMHSRLTYNEPITYAGTGGDWVTVDLKTGQEIWRNKTMSAAPSFGWYYDDDNMNQHGIVNPSWIFSNNFGTAIHPRYGTTVALNITNVPTGGGETIGPQGEVLRYIIANEGTDANPRWYLYQWNSSKVFIAQNTGTRNASIYGNLSPYDWNVSISASFSTTPTVRAAILNDVLLISNGSFIQGGTGSMGYANAEATTLTGISIKDGELGRVLFQKNYPLTNSDGTQDLFIRAGEGVFFFQHMPDLTFTAYDMYNGNKLWSSPPLSEENAFGYFTWSSLMNVYATSIAYGKFFATGYTGMVHCYDLKNGTLLWKQEALTYGEIFKYYTLFIGAIADGKIYIGTHEHSADTPLLKGAKTRVFDVETGEEIWSMLGWAHPGTMAIADGVLIYWNNYDHQVYAVGKGPSETTVRIENDVIADGSRVMIKGTVHDVSAGTKQAEREYRFTTGVPAISDESQSDWMEYVYMQKPRPTDATGVDVVLSVLDPNGNFYEIGTTTSNSYGDYNFMWEPPVPGIYQVFANFKGSESYYASRASTAFGVIDSPDASPAPTNQPASVADQFFIPATVGIIVAIIAVGALLAMLLLKKRV